MLVRVLSKCMMLEGHDEKLGGASMTTFSTHTFGHCRIMLLRLKIALRQLMLAFRQLLLEALLGFACSL